MSGWRQKKSSAAWLLLFLLCVFAIFPLVSFPAEAASPSFDTAVSTPPSHQINVVFDDSGSMIINGKELTDRWCQAKYAMEVFAAMMGSQDNMSIYYMSDYSKGKANGAGLKLSGASGAAANVARVHSKVTQNADTPFAAVQAAYNDLQTSDADQKWLVILTDGAFNDMDQAGVEQYLRAKTEDTRVIYLAMGDGATPVTADPDHYIYSDHAVTSDDILTKVTDICTYIYNSDRLDIQDHMISFDVPMSELTVFAQGANVRINGITDSSGRTYQPSFTPVTVAYSDIATTRPSVREWKINKDLKGSIATFTEAFAPGEYTVDVEEASTVEVYYKPDVAIAITLRDDKGNVIEDGKNLRSGEYTLDFGFVKNGTGDPVGTSSLLGAITFDATIENNGQVIQKEIHQGEHFQVEEGDVDITATAHYLGYHTVTTNKHYGVFSDKSISFERLDDQKDVSKSNRGEDAETTETGITADGGVSETPFLVCAKVADQDISEEAWASMGTPKISIDEKPFHFLWMTRYTQETPTIEKTADPGVYRITPHFILDEDGAPQGIDYRKTIPYHLAMEEQHGDAKWSGTFDDTFKVQDARGWLARHWDLTRLLTVMAVILVIAIGYLPPFKKYFPRSMKQHPSISMRPTVVGMTVPKQKFNGSFEKLLSTTLIPYKAQEGTLKYTPGGVSSTRLRLKATGGSSMIVRNFSAFAGKKNIRFDGEPVQPDARRLRISAGTQIEFTANNIKYTCMPNT